MNAVKRDIPIPGPRGHFLLGSLPEFSADMLEFMQNCRHEHGTIVRFRLGPRKIILISEPELIEQVLVSKNKSFRKHFATRLLKPVLGRGLLLGEGEAWLKQRRLIQPAFSRKFMSEFTTVVSHHTSQLAEHWRREPRRDLYHDMTDLTLQIAAEAFLGVKDTQVVRDIGDCLEFIHADFEHRFQQFWNPPEWMPTRRNRSLRGVVRRLTQVIDEMIAYREREQEEGHDVLSLLLRARDESGRPMPRQLLRDEVMTMLLAGHDTTANTLVWTWNLLAQHPDVATTLRGSTSSSEGSVSNDPQGANNDAYVMRVIKESMRLYPPVYVFGREAVEDVQIGDHVVRRGENVLMSQWVVHRDERLFVNPTEFIPERWSAELERDLPHHAYFPFGGGPRICIGKDAAMQEAAIVLSHLAAQFTIELECPEEVVPWPTVTLRPQGAIHVNVSPTSTQSTTSPE